MRCKIFATCLQAGSTACPTISPGSCRCSQFKIQKAVFVGKNKVLCQPIEDKNRALEDTNITRIPPDQQDGKGVEIYSDL